MTRRALLLLLFPFSACTCQDTINQLNAVISVEPMMLDFGSVGIGGTKTLMLSLTNKGSFALDVSGFSVEAPFLAPTSTRSASRIETAATLMVKVGFRPTALGASSGNLVFVTSDPKAKMVTIPVKGIGIQASVKVDPLTVDFGDVLYNSMTMPKTAMVMISNPGTDSFDVTAIDLTDNANGAFTIDPMMAKKTFAPGNDAPFSVSFTPKERGPALGAVHVKTTAPDGADITVSLKANGVGPMIQLCAALDGQMESCTTNGAHPKLVFHVPKDASGSGTVRVLNVGDRDLTIFETLASGQSSHFSFSPPVPSMSSTVIMPNQDAKWSVTFAPHDYMYQSFILTFVSDSADKSGSSLVVEGHIRQPTIEVRPESLTFTLTGLANSAQVPVNIFNCGDQPLTLGAIAMAQATALSLSGVPASGTTINPQNCASDPAGASFMVVFMPPMNGTYMGSVQVPSSDPIRPVVNVMLTGTKN